jgi:hypothetical protein
MKNIFNKRNSFGTQAKGQAPSIQTHYPLKGTAVI